MSTQESEVAESHRVSLAFTNVKYYQDSERVKAIVGVLFSHFPSLKALNADRLINAVFAHDYDTIAELQRTQFPAQQDLVELPPKNKGSMSAPVPMILPFGDNGVPSEFAVRVSPQIGYVSFIVAEVNFNVVLIIEIGNSPFHDRFLGEAIRRLKEEMALPLRYGVYDFADTNLEVQCEVERKMQVPAAA